LSKLYYFLELSRLVSLRSATLYGGEVIFLKDRFVPRPKGRSPRDDTVRKTKNPRNE